MSAWSVLAFIIGAQLGLISGALMCVRYVRQELTARITPAIELVDLRLANLNSRVVLALENQNQQPRQF